MKKFLSVIFFLFIPFYAISQSLTPIEDEETHKIGFLNEKGDTVVPFVYDKVHMLYHYEFRNGICKVAKKDSGFGYIDTMGRELNMGGKTMIHYQSSVLQYWLFPSHLPI